MGLFCDHCGCASVGKETVQCRAYDCGRGCLHTFHGKLSAELILDNQDKVLL